MDFRKFQVMAELRKWLTMLSLLGWMICTAMMHAQQSREFDALVLNLRSGGGNTLLMLLPLAGLRGVDTETGEVVAHLQVTVSVRNAVTQSVVWERSRREDIRQGFENVEDPFLLSYPISLRPGRYQFEVEVRDLRTQAVHFTSIAHEVRDLEAGPGLSDILIAQGLAGADLPTQPLLGAQLVPFPESQLIFGGDIYGIPGATYALRIVLYKQSSPEQGESVGYDYAKVQTFSSLQQLNDAVKLGPQGVMHYEKSIPLDPLEEGEYLMEATLFEGETRISETGRSFTIPWKGLREIFSRLEEAIDRMEYVASPAWMSQLKSESNPGLKQEKFLRFWNMQAGPGGDGLLAMRQYFERVYAADHLFAEGEKAGWATDRGKVYCLYGPPDKKENLDHKGNLVEVWSYLPRNLRMVFLVKGDSYQWVQPYHQ